MVFVPFSDLWTLWCWHLGSWMSCKLSLSTAAPVVLRLVQLVPKLIEEPRVKDGVQKIRDSLPFDKDLGLQGTSDDDVAHP